MSSWSAKRRLLYLGAVLLFFAMAVSFFYVLFFRRPSSCSDNIKNQDEIDVDCGGVCKKVCALEISPLIKDWVRFFKIGDGKYDVAALVENPNFGLGLKGLDYVFKLYDIDNLFITEKSGHIFVNSRDKFVIFETGLDTGKRIPIKAMIEFKDRMVWSRVDPKKDKPSIVLQNQGLAEGQMPRLSTEVTNNSIFDLADMIVVAVVYDEDKNAIAVSRTFINYLKKGATEKISFTWPKPFVTSRPTVEIYPRVDLVGGNEI